MHHTAAPKSYPHTSQSIIRDYEFIASNSLATAILDGLPVISMLLNTQRELVYGNKALLSALDINDPKALLGMKPGELFGCRHTLDNKSCGSSKVCVTCGAYKSATDCIDYGESVEEATLNTTNGTLNLNTTSKYINFEGREFILFTMQDISNEKKRLMLERIFYHGILNTAHNISGMAELLMSGDFKESNDEFLSLLYKASSRMIDEINTHRLISFDKEIEQVREKKKVNSFDFFNEMRIEFSSFTNDENLFILDNRSESFDFKVDKVLFNRVVTNMIKNAFEAEMLSAPVTLGLIPMKNKGVMVWVHNPSFMDEDVQMQVFNRSFSTKSSDRGLGTYSMKIITERYLKGKIYFTSKPGSGTTFILEIPG
ncbi:MAG: HAMP domain-containing sensor histidine kinase [Lentimicrobiaceae bacterium]|nr:HAMP domain-containing sensor histidine kinase [Lentimicrobiaceae bacterium]